MSLPVSIRLFFIYLLILLSGFSTVVMAKDQEEEPESTPTHVIGFTFHKLAGTEPDYSKWANVYLDGQLRGYGDEGKKEKIRQTRSRFVNNFNNFRLDKQDDIVIVLPAQVEIVPFESRYLLNIDLAAGTDFIIKETPERLINLVVPDLGDKLKTIIDREDYKDIKKASGLSFEKPEPVNLVLKLKPVSVDAEKPLHIDGEDYWLMLMEFSTYELWEYRNVMRYWVYISEEEKQKKLDELRSLYKGHEGDMNHDRQFLK